MRSISVAMGSVAAAVLATVVVAGPATASVVQGCVPLRPALSGEDVRPGKLCPPPRNPHANVAADHKHPFPTGQVLRPLPNGRPGKPAGSCGGAIVNGTVHKTDGHDRPTIPFRGAGA